MNPDFNKLIKQAQQMQNQVQSIQQELEKIVVKGEAGGGAVWIEMTGRHDPQKLHIDNDLIVDASSGDAEDKAVLEDLIIAAIRDAVRKIEKTSKEKLSTLASAVQLPAGFGSPSGDA